MQEYNSKFKTNLKQRCYEFSLALISLIDRLPNQRSAHILGSQLLRSGTSVGANLIESTAASSRIEFKRFHEIALKRANESKYWLGLLKESRKVDSPTSESLLCEITEIANMLASGVLRLKGKK